MNNRIKRTLAIALSLMMLISALPLSAAALTAPTDNTKVGDIIEFGTYPQSEITDADTVFSMYEAVTEWISYDYYSGSGESYNGNMSSSSESDFMKYGDITYGGERYRVVMFTDYRPKYAHMTNNPDYSYQDDNGYQTNMPFVFKYEPVKWRVLDPAEGLVMCESIIDAQAYCEKVYFVSKWGSEFYYNDSANTIYANSYADSSIRTWMNDDFYNTAFSDEEKALIAESVVENKGDWDTYTSATTNDKLFLLSSADVKNTAYGFSGGNYDSALQATGTAYAKCQGLLTNGGNNMYTGKSTWYLRTAGNSDYYANYVGTDGQLKNSFVFDTSYGIRPAMRIQVPHTHDFSEYVFNNDATCTADGTETATCTCGETDTRTKTGSALGHAWDAEVINTPATCTVAGLKTLTCSRCLEETQVVIPATNHANAYPVTGIFPTCTANGASDGVYCPDCKTWLSGHEELLALGHTWNDGEVTAAATCTTAGVKTFTCTVCNATKTEEIAAVNHANAYIVAEVGALCTETGYTEGVYCPDCQKWLSGHEIIDVTAHVDANHDGKCDNCGAEVADEDCNCICHSTGFMQFIYKIVRFFWKLFGINQYCVCGVAHY